MTIHGTLEIDLPVFKLGLRSKYNSLYRILVPQISFSHECVIQKIDFHIYKYDV